MKWLILIASIPLLAQLKDTGPRYLGSYTVATLPAAASYSGFVAVVTDAATAGSCTAGSGAAISLCRSNGTAWETLGGTANAGFVVTKTSPTVLGITAGISRIGSVTTSTAASTVTISGSTASSTAYIYISSVGLPTVGHNGAATLTSTGYTVATGIVAFPDDSIPIATVTYTSNVWDTSGITPLVSTVSRSVILPGYGLSSYPDAAGNQTLSSVGPVTLKSYLTLGPLPGNSESTTAVFAANETRWYLFTLLGPGGSFNTVGIYASAGIGASKGIRAAIADTTGTILYTSAVQTTCASNTLCLMTFSPTVVLPAGQYYMGITTDSTAFTSFQARWPYQNLDERMQRNTGTSISTMGTGTAGSGTAGSVAFGASMGSLTKWTSAGESVTKLIETYLDTI